MNTGKIVPHLPDLIPVEKNEVIAPVSGPLQHPGRTMSQIRCETLSLSEIVLKMKLLLLFRGFDLLVIALDLTAAGGFSESFWEGLFYWNIESSEEYAWKFGVGETIRSDFGKLVCRAGSIIDHSQFVQNVRLVFSDGYVTSTFMDVICEANGRHRKLRSRQMNSPTAKTLFRTRQEWNIRPGVLLMISTTPAESDNSRLSEDLKRLKDLDDFPRCCVMEVEGA